MNDDAKKPVRLAFLGCGTVGQSALALLEERAESIAAAVGAPIVAERIVVRDASRARSGVSPELLTTDANSALNDPRIDIVVEVMGGHEPARGYIEAALDAGKSVVTANKLLMANVGPELIDKAQHRGSDLLFEGAVGGGIPVVRVLRDAFRGDRIRSAIGILNGTTNYVLTRMLDAGLSFDDAVAEAQQLGYAEADPSMDVDGHDAAHKLTIVAMLAFGVNAVSEPMHVEGIRALEPVDHRFAERFGYRIKHVVIGRDDGEWVELRTHPVLVSSRSVLANVDGALNAVLLDGDAVGPSLVYGQGAGGHPTAVSVLGDIIDAARSVVAGVKGLSTRSIVHRQRRLRPMGLTSSRYYIRFRVRDRPGVMAQIATALGSHEVSIEQMLQDRKPEQKGGPADVVMLTHRAQENAVRAALQDLEGTDSLMDEPCLVRMLDS